MRRPTTILTTVLMTALLLAVLNLAPLPSNFPGLAAAAASQQAPGVPGEAARVSVGPNQGAFLILTDIHFDPFTDRAIVSRLNSSPVEQWPFIFQSSRDQSWSRGAVDTNYPLLVSAINAAKNSAAKVSGARFDYVVVNGDYLAHNFRLKFRAAGLDDADYQSFAIKTEVFVSRMIQQAFPQTPIVAALGNNDSICDDYYAPGGALLAALAKEWKVVGAHRDAAGDFAIGGYYAVPHPTLPNQELIVLNTNFWSPNYHAGCSLRAGDPGALELRWLQGRLRQLQRAGKTATLVMHIPPGIDAYASSKKADCNNPTLLWKKQYADSFLKTSETYKGLLRDSYAGHTHHDDFLVLTDGGAPFLQVHITPAVSPIYSNSPSFEEGLYDKTSGALADYSVVYLRNYFATGAGGDPPDWENEYAFRQTYGSEGAGPADLRAVSGMIRSDPNIRAKFSDFYAAHSPVDKDITTKNWPSFSCAQTEITASDFSRCVCPVPTVAK